MPDDIFAQICADMDAREQAGEFGRLFKEEIKPSEQTDQSKLLHTFKSGMKLYKSTFLKIYGYELSYPGYAEKALSWLEMLGCSKARKYYADIVAEYKHEKDKELKNVASWYKEFSEGEFERKRKEVKEEHWRQKEAEQLTAQLRDLTRKELKNLTRKELTELCQNLLREGIISEPEQFATAVLQDL